MPQQAERNQLALCTHASGSKALKGVREGASPSKVCFEGLQDAHKASAQKALKARKRRFAPLETKHTVTSVVWLPDSHVVASSGEDTGNCVAYVNARAHKVPPHCRAVLGNTTCR